jgi:recombination protein RecT
MSTALLKTPIRQVQSVKHLLMNEHARDQLAMVAAKHLNPERMMRVMANAVRTTPKLGQCEPMSFLGALMQCASLGLEPNTVLGHAYMIPFENRRKGVTEVQVIVGYKGLLDLARRSGHITSLSANIHYSDDELWEYEEGTESRLRHRPGPMEGEKLHAYAIAKFKDGGHAYVVMPWAHVMKIRDGSQGYQTAKRFNKLADSPWVKHEDEMAKKTAVRALAKYLPLSVEFSDAMQVDEQRADYRAFAMDPTQGLMPEEANDEPIEGQAVEADAPSEQPSETQKEPEAPSDEPDLSHHQAVLDEIAAGLLDSPQPETVLNDYKAEIAAMKGEAPGVFKALEEEVAAYAPDLVGKL